MGERIDCNSNLYYFDYPSDTSFYHMVRVANLAESNDSVLNPDRQVFFKTIQGPRLFYRQSSIRQETVVNDYFGGYEIGTWGNSKGDVYHSHLQLIPEIDEITFSELSEINEIIQPAHREQFLQNITSGIPRLRISKDHGIQLFKNNDVKEVVSMTADNNFEPKVRNINSPSTNKISADGIEFAFLGRYTLDLGRERKILAVKFILSLGIFPPNLDDIDAQINLLSREDSSEAYSKLREQINYRFEIGGVRSRFQS